MSNEASKAKKYWGQHEFDIIAGKGIDIGCGNDPISENVKKFDVGDGDANTITKYVHEDFDFVFSCHCLEHMNDPELAIQEWWKLVRPGGYLIIIVPDEDLYEQGYFPSLFNSDHKSTFTISKHNSWSTRSYNILDLIKKLNNHYLLKINLQDAEYKRSLMNHSLYSRNFAKTGLKIVRNLTSIFKLTGFREQIYAVLVRLSRLPIDQTAGEALAQIEVIVQKKG